jgi:serine/threonine protein kinase
MQGGNLEGLIKQQKVKNNKLEEPEIRNILIQILRGLVDLHSRSIIHRYLKPA